MSFELASAYVRIFVEDSAVNKSLGNIRNNLSGTTTSMQKGMAGVRTGMNGTMTQLNRGIVTFTRNFRKIAAPILQVSKWYMAAVTGLATKALHALYGDDSKAGRAWKRTFDVFKIRLNTEMARIANILLKVPIFGNTIPQWMDKLIASLQRMDLTKIKEMVKLFEKAAIAVVAIKGLSIVGNVAAGLTGVGRLLSPKPVRQAVGESIAMGAAAGASGMGVFQALIRVPKALKAFSSLNSFMTMTREKGHNLNFPEFEKGARETFKAFWERGKTGKYHFEVPQAELFRDFFNENTKKGMDTYSAIANSVKRTRDVQTAQTLLVGTNPLIKVSGVLQTLGSGLVKAFNYILLPLEALAGLFAGLGFKSSSAFDLLWTIIKKLGTAFLILLEVLSIPIRAFRAGFQSIGIIMRNIFTGSFQQMADELEKMWNGMTDAIGTRLGNLWTPLDVAEEQETKATARQRKIAGLEGIERPKFGGQYIGLTEGVKFAQDVAKKDNEYLKQIAASTITLADLAKGASQ